jgi:hypothetical protein
LSKGESELFASVILFWKFEPTISSVNAPALRAIAVNFLAPFVGSGNSGSKQLRPLNPQGYDPQFPEDP